jgi:hypothetical protein
LKYKLQDLGSVNGTFVNDRKLKPEEIVTLRNGDKLFFAPSNAPAARQGYTFEYLGIEKIGNVERPISPCGLPPLRPDFARNFRSPSPVRGTSPANPSPSFLPFVREVETALGLEISDQPIFRRRRRIVETIAGLRTQQRTGERRSVAESEIYSLKMELQNTLGSLCQLVEDVHGNSAVDLLLKLKFALEEVLRRDSLATRRWNALVAELNAKRAELKVYKDAVDERPAGTSDASMKKLSGLRLRLADEISDPTRQAAAEIVVRALEATEQANSDLKRDNLKLRAHLASLKERVAPMAIEDAAIEADADGRIEEVVRLRSLIAGLGLSAESADASSPAPIEVRDERGSGGGFSGAATPEIRGIYWGERKIAEDFEEELLRDSQIPRWETEEDEAARLNCDLLCLAVRGNVGNDRGDWKRGTKSVGHVRRVPTAGAWTGGGGE